MDLKGFIKKLVNPSPRKTIQKYSDIFKVENSAIILDSTRFDFRVERTEKIASIIIGSESMIGCNFIFESSGGHISIGNRTFINAGTNLISREAIIIGDDVTIGWGCYIYDHDSHSLDWKERQKDISQQIIDYKKNNMLLNKNWESVNAAPIKICDKVWIGFEAVILKGVTIGEGAVVGARAVVAKDVEPWTVIAGNPARVIRRLTPLDIR